VLSFPLDPKPAARLLWQAYRNVGVLRDAGGKGSGNYGHAGRPGEVGGSGEGARAPIQTGPDNRIAWQTARVAGGKGSGNYGHAGRPGEIGGSGEGGDTRSTPFEPTDQYPSSDGPRWTGPVKESGLTPQWDKADYDEFTNHYGLGPCAAMCDIMAADGLGRVAFCNAKAVGEETTWPHYVIIDRKGAILDRTNPFGSPLTYYGVQYDRPLRDKSPRVTADEIMTPDMQPFIREQMARKKG